MLVTDVTVVWNPEALETDELTGTVVATDVIADAGGRVPSGRTAPVRI